MFDMLTGQYKNLASKGRYGDTMLAHINPQEAGLLRAMGGAGTINPQTNLREFFGTGQIKELDFLKEFRPDTYQAPFGTYDMRGASPERPAPIDRKFADIVQLGMGSQRVEGYTVPTEGKTFADIPLVSKYDPKGNFNYLTLQPGKYLTPDPSQPNIQSVPRLNASGEVVDWGIVDVNDLDNGSFGSIIRELGTELGPMIALAIGANLLGPAAGAVASGGGAAALSPYAAQAAGAYTGSAAAAAGAAAGNLGLIQAANLGQNALTAEASGRTGITYGGNVTPADIPTTTTSTTTTPEPAPLVTPTGGYPSAPTGIPPGTPPVISPPVISPPVISPPVISPPVISPPVIPPPVIPPGIIDTIIKNPSIAGTVIGAVTSAVGGANAPKSTTATTSIDPDIKAKYLAYLTDAEKASTGLLERKFAPIDPMYTTAETNLYNLGMTPFGAAVTPTATTAATTQPSSGNVLTPEIARTLMQRSMTTGLPYSESDKYGGYAAVKAMYDAGGGNSGSPQPATQLPVFANDIARFFNPYENQVVTNTLADIESARKIQEQANRDQATRARAFGGSRQAVVSGMTNEAALRQSANTAAQLRSAGFTQAANLGLAARPLDIAGLQTSMNLGTARTTLAQQKLDAARNLALERLAITGGALGLQPGRTGETTSQPLYNNTAGNLLSGGLTGAYIGSLLQPRTT